MSELRRQDLPPEDLSDLGSPAARGAGLAGLIGGHQSPDEQAAETGWSPSITAVAAPPTTAGDERTGVVTPRRARTPGRPRTRAKPTAAVYVSPGVKQRFEAYRHKNKATNLQVVLEAISSSHHELPDIIKRSTVSTAPVNPLFPADPAAVRYLGGGSVQIGFSPTPGQEEVIDRIGAELGFDTRSTWIAPVLNAFLPGRKDA